eukprot:c5669_g1_i1.p1 GENE.c5669_g1_i1~~c5669_g1_i1.p1  ORF type:complete len:115 (+),score=38.60 c5669_g1_i1:58-402(+)
MAAASNEVLGCKIVHHDMKDMPLKKAIITEAKSLIDKAGKDIHFEKIAKTLRAELEKKHGMTWNVMVGTGGLVSAVYFEQEKFLYFKYKTFDVIAFKTFEQHGNLKVQPASGKK